MGSLTQDMARLREEIVGLRESREFLLKGLAQETLEAKGQVSAMREGFRNAHADMAAHTRAEHARFVSNMTGEVAGMLNGFQRAHREMSVKTKRDNVKFVTDLSTEVSGVLTGFHRAQAEMAANMQEREPSVRGQHGKGRLRAAERISRCTFPDGQDIPI